MTDCPNGALRDLLPDLVNDRLSAEMRHDVELHLATCAECASELVLLEKLRASMARVPMVDPARIAAAIPTYRPPARPAWGGWRAAAAIAVLVAGGASVAVVRQAGAPRELAMASGAASELSDGELQALLKDIESIDAVPSVDVENAAPVSPVSPRGRSE